MKKQYAYFGLATGIALLFACGSESKGENPSSIISELENIEDEIIEEPAEQDSVTDSVKVIKLPIQVLPPPPPPPPEPWPGPYPEPDPDPMFRTPSLPPPPPPNDTEPVEESIIQFPEIDAKFVDGTAALLKFIADNIDYPTIDIEAGVQGRVYVSFVVERNGDLTDVKILRGVSPTIDREAKRVIRAMPKWTPAQSKGKNVRSLFRLPIKFKLE